MILKGNLVDLRTMTLRERPLFFRWATRSDATPYWYGELYGDEVPSYVIFKLEWPNYYFDGSQPELGRCFMILREGRPIGQINYNKINNKDKSVELDILIAKQKDLGKGYGTDAIRTLTTYLFRAMDVRRCRIEVLAKNPRAVRAYEKAGFSHSYAYTRENIEWRVMEMMADAFPERKLVIVNDLMEGEKS